jgi:hypothetical protein
MKNYFYFAAFCLLIISCNDTNSSVSTTSTSDNDTGYQMLFDGKTMTGWRSYQNKPQDSWSVVDGVLY